MFKARSKAVIALVVGGLTIFSLGACGSSEDEEAGTSASTQAATTSEGAGKAATVDPSKSPVVIALHALQIPTTDILTPFTAGANAAADEINAAGGFGGHKVEIEPCNTAYTPATAAVCARKTLAMDPIASVGCEPVWGTSGLPLYAKAKIPSINCPNSEEDFTNPYSIGMSSGQNGDFRAEARWICTMDDVEKVAVFTQDVPLYRKATPAAVGPVFEECGKSVEYFYYPITGEDITAHVNQAAQSEPDFVITLGGGATAVNIYKLFGQAGIPADRIIGSSNQTDYHDSLEPAGEVMDGAYTGSQVTSWGDTSDPGIQAYLKAMEGSDTDPRGSNQLTGYMLVMTVYESAKNIGFDRLTSQTLTDYLNTANDVSIPGTRKIVNPGPAEAPQIKQPYTQIVQWKDGKLNVVQEGTEDGWVTGH